MKRIESKLMTLIETEGWTQKELAKAANVRPATIHALCHGNMKRYPSDVLARIADVLDVEDMNKLLRIEEDETNA